MNGSFSAGFINEAELRARIGLVVSAAALMGAPADVVLVMVAEGFAEMAATAGRAAARAGKPRRPPRKKGGR